MWPKCDLAPPHCSTVLRGVPASCRHGACFRMISACSATTTQPQRQCRCFAKPSKQTRTESAAKRQSRRTIKSPQPDDKGAGLGLSKWNFFTPEDFKAVPAWDVPWGWQTIVFGMFAWGFTFILTGLLSLPISIAVLDIENLKSLSAMQQSGIQLVDQVRISHPNAQPFRCWYCEHTSHLSRSDRPPQSSPSSDIYTLDVPPTAPRTMHPNCYHLQCLLLPHCWLLWDLVHVSTMFCMCSSLTEP